MELHAASFIHFQNTYSVQYTKIVEEDGIWYKVLDVNILLWEYVHVVEKCWLLNVKLMHVVEKCWLSNVKLILVIVAIFACCCKVLAFKCDMVLP